MELTGLHDSLVRGLVSFSFFHNFALSSTSLLDASSKIHLAMVFVV